MQLWCKCSKFVACTKDHTFTKDNIGVSKYLHCWTWVKIYLVCRYKFIYIAVNIVSRNLQIKLNAVIFT